MSGSRSAGCRVLRLGSVLIEEGVSASPEQRISGGDHRRDATRLGRGDIGEFHSQFPFVTISTSPTCPSGWYSQR